MKLEFHQLNRRYEHLRVRRPQQQRRLMASLASSGQQTPIVVVVVSSAPDSYLVIDGYKRIAALEQLGRDTVEAVIWAMSESDALVLDVQCVLANARQRWNKDGCFRNCTSALATVWPI